MRRSLFLVLTLTSASILGWFINAHRPDNLISMGIFFLLTFCTLLFFSITLTKKFFHSVLVSAGITTIFVFRAFGIRNFVYVILLILFFVLMGIICERSRIGKTGIS